MLRLDIQSVVLIFLVLLKTVSVMQSAPSLETAVLILVKPVYVSFREKRNNTIYAISTLKLFCNFYSL